MINEMIVYVEELGYNFFFKTNNSERKKKKQWPNSSTFEDKISFSSIRPASFGTLCVSSCYDLLAEKKTKSEK